MSVKPETRSLLVEAFTRLNIPPKGVSLEGAHLFSKVHWEETPIGDINLILSTWNFGAGRLSCSIEVSTLVERTLEVIKDPADALATVLDMCEYFKCVMFTLLPMTHHNVITRASNRDPTFLAAYGSATNFRDFFEQVLLSFQDNRDALEQKLRGTPKRKRGGSDPRLPSDQRESLHTQYDALHKIAREVKKDYNQTLKRFEKARRGRGYPNEEWKRYWCKYLSEKYPSEFIGDFLAVFADEDSPSASDVAYTRLAKHTHHEKSYLPQLVARSRKASKSTNNQTEN